MKECDILRGQNTLWPFLHIFRGGSEPPYPLDLRQWWATRFFTWWWFCWQSIVGRTACEPWSM